MTYKLTREPVDRCTELEVGALYAVEGTSIQSDVFLVVAEQPCWNVDRVRIYYRVLWSCGELLTWFVDPHEPGRARSEPLDLSVYKLRPRTSL
jgi:hypothetical protein